MSHTVIGIFNKSSEAKEAVEQLVEAGYSRDDIDFSNRQSTRTEAQEIHEENTGENAVTKFFRWIFGKEDDETEKYARVAYETGTVVSVYCYSEDEANRAAELLDDNGAIDVDEAASRYGEDWQRVPSEARNIASEEVPHYGTTTDGTRPNRQSAHEKHHTDHKTPVVTQETTRTGERTSPGTGVEETGGSTSKSRVIPWKGEASARLREDRLTETKFW